MVVSQRLEHALGRAVAGEVRFDNGARAAYASEASNYRQVPVGVARVEPGAVCDALREAAELLARALRA